MAARVLPVLVTGGNGRLGRILRAHWPWAMRDGLRPVWQARRPVPGCVTWDLAAEPAPAGLAGGIVLALAGGAAAGGADTALALAACRAAADQGARQVFLASSAAVYGGGEGDHGEDAPLAPRGAYGAAKAAMEAAALAWAAATAGAPALTILRIGNVAGADSLLAAAGRGPVALDPGPDGRGPVRSYIGPATLAAALARLAALAAAGTPLPPVLNLAAPVPVAMAALLDAAGIAWTPRPGPAQSPPRVVMDCRRLTALVRLPPQAGLPRTLVAEWRALPGAAA